METPGTTPDPMSMQPEPKKSNTGLIIAVVVVVLLCCCCILAIGGWALWVNGDQLIHRSANLLLNLL